jgi:hydroxymethylpyrimidine pyrophosphatase-like HAD family hydrolase
MGQEIIRDIQARGHEAVVSCKDESYIAAGNPAFRDYLTQSLGNSMAVVDDLLSVDGEYLKISAYIPKKNALEEVAHYQAKRGNQLHVAVAGNAWVDHTMASKGDAIKALRARLKLHRGEMMAFGDNFNDETMLMAVEHSYAMAGAHENIKKISAHVCTRVEDVLKDLLLSPEDNIQDVAWMGRLNSIISS